MNLQNWLLINVLSLMRLFERIHCLKFLYSLLIAYFAYLTTWNELFLSTKIWIELLSLRRLIYFSFIIIFRRLNSRFVINRLINLRLCLNRCRPINSRTYLIFMRFRLHTLRSLCWKVRWLPLFILFIRVYLLLKRHYLRAVLYNTCWSTRISKIILVHFYCCDW